MRAKQRKRKRATRERSKTKTLLDFAKYAINAEMNNRFRLENRIESLNKQLATANETLYRVCGIRQNDASRHWEVRVCISDAEARHIHEYAKESFARLITEQIMREVLKCPAIAQSGYEWRKPIGARQ